MICAFGLFRAEPSRAAIFALTLLGFTVFFLGATGRGLYNIDGRRNDARPNLAWGFLGPLAVLCIRAIYDFHYLNWTLLPLIGVARGAIIGYGQVYSTKVTGVRTSRGRRSTTYYVMVEPWGPVEEKREISVNRNLYFWAEPGKSVCIKLHKGLFDVPWFNVGAVCLVRST